MRYVIAIPAFLACGFYIYVLIQLRRDEKRHKSPPAMKAAHLDQPREVVSFTAVRGPGQSFAQWSRLAGRRSGTQAIRKSSEPPKQNPTEPKLRRFTYVELGLPLSSGVAPMMQDCDMRQMGTLPKKFA
jgi:hypothetical protein